MKFGKRNPSFRHFLVFLVFLSALLGACKKSNDGNDDTILTLLLLQATAATPCTTRCHIYLSEKYGGALGIGGIKGPDAICNGDINRVKGKTYKAMISVPGSREITGSATGTPTYTDWVLKANTFYSNSTDPSNTTGSTTNANRIFRDSNVTMQMNFPLGTNGTTFWTGITITGGNFANGDNCTNWSTIGAGVNGQVGVVGASATTLVDATTNVCNVSNRVVCVEQ
ncbi:Len family endostatin-like outer membrane lipoprotein [Leptospira wolbachii]